MEPIVLYPDQKLRGKLFLIAAGCGLLSLITFVGFGVLIGSSEAGPRAAGVGALIGVGSTLIWLVPALIVIPFYYRSLKYEIHEDEVIVRAGVITRSVKHVPYRTVTNLTVKRGPFDRLLGIGTLKIQTAGMSGQTGAEESLMGLVNYNEIYEKVAGSLRRFRGGMSPTQAGVEPVGANGDATMLAAILDEVKAIREALSQE
jgi:membrane protein YdbS with pleckstrin-like domain